MAKPKQCNVQFCFWRMTVNTTITALLYNRSIHENFGTLDEISRLLIKLIDRTNSTSHNIHISSYLSREEEITFHSVFHTALISCCV